MKNNKVPVLITTDKDKRGVFFAYINPADVAKDNIEASDIQMCMYWSTEVRGVLGLASVGPIGDSRVTAPVPEGVIKGVTFVARCSDEAVKVWKAVPWKS